MSPYFDQIERDLVAAAERRAVPMSHGSRPARSIRALAIAAALVLGAAGTAAGAAYYVLRASPIAPFAPDDSTPEQTIEPGTSRVLDLRAVDPDPGRPPWTLRLSRSRTGLLCSTVGQVDDQDFGLVGLDNRFRGIPEANADGCGQDVEDDATLLGTRIFDGSRDRDVRTVVDGVAEHLASVTVSERGHPARPVAHSPEGGFLLVLRGYPEDVQPVVTLRFADGHVRRNRFAADPRIVADPFGERAWRIESFGFGVGSKPGKRPPRPTSVPHCVRFLKARVLPGRRNAFSPAVCGVSRLFFTTRRLSGDSDSRDILLAGDWNGHPARTAVYGQARGRVVVTAPGERHLVDAGEHGPFLVILPATVDPAKVHVETGGRGYGPVHATVKDPHPR